MSETSETPLGRVLAQGQVPDCDVINLVDGHGRLAGKRWAVAVNNHDVMVLSHQTGQAWAVSWADFVLLALAAGVDRQQGPRLYVPEQSVEIIRP